MSHDNQAIFEQLREAGFRVTPQRHLILDAVCELGGHVTPEAVFEHVQAIAPTLNRATVYRTLSFLSEQRILTDTRLSDGRTGYELASPDPHHHLVCRHCRTSLEMPHAMVRRLYRAVAQAYDFQIDMNHITLQGLCADCRRPAGGSQNPEPGLN